MDVFKLRPHHINCLFFYEGKGYSEEFVKNMDKIVGHLKSTPVQKITLQVENDKLCSACPHLKEKVCISQEKVKQLDQATLEAYGLKVREIYPFEFIKENIYKNYSAKTFEKICSPCEWYKKGVCTEAKISVQREAWK